MLQNGLAAINAEFLTFSMRNVVGDEQGGLFHALIGTLLVTGMAALISVPIGVFAAIYLVEYGAGKRLARTITFLVDVMTGIPSIVAGPVRALPVRDHPRARPCGSGSAARWPSRC